MNWSQAGNWEYWDGDSWEISPTYPGEVAGTGDVTIQDGHTVTIDVSPAQPISRLFVGEGTSGVLQYEPTTARTLMVSEMVRINQAGIFRSALSGTVTTHQLEVGGSIVNNGTLDFSTAANAAGAGITFTGASNELFDLSGATLTNLRQSNGLFLNKGTSASSFLSFTPGGIFQVQSANALGFLTIQSGTFRLMGENTFSNPLFYASNGSYTIPSTGGFQLDNPNVTIVGMYGTLTNNGELIIRRGVFDIGTGTGNESLTTSTGTFLMSGGEMNISGRFRIDAGNCTLSGGTLNLATIGHANRTLAAFHISESANLTISGNSLVTFAFPNSNTVPFNDIEIVSGTGLKTITGGTFQMGTDATTIDRTFLVNSDIPIHNLVVYNEHTRVSLTDHLIINNQLTLNGRLLMVNYNLNLGAPAIAGDFSNNAMIIPGTGEVRKAIITGGSYVFPFGTTTYLPVTLDFTGGTFAPGASVSVSMDNVKHSQNLNTTNYLRRFWTVQTDGITNPVYNFSGTYTTGDIQGSDSWMTAGIYTTSWRKVRPSINGNFTINANGLTGNADITGINSVATEVTVTASPSTVCSGSPVQLTTTATGDAPFTYSWISNPAGFTSTDAYPSVNPTITTAYTVTVTDAMGGSATASATVTVNPQLPVSVSIASSDADNTICAGESVTFTATPTNGGTPSYQWYVGSTPVGTNSPTYTTTTLPTGQAVTVVMTSNAPCATGSPATSNAITTTVNPNLPVSVSIVSNDTDNSICEGTNVTFTATPINGGTTPSYQWYVGPTPVGTNSPTYTTTTLPTGQAVTVVMTSNAPCATGSPATSNAITTTVNPNLPVSVNIAASANPVCAGTEVTFTASLTNGGTVPTYQWRVNGNSVGSNSATYSYIPSNNDIVTCILTSDATCATGSPATSNQVTITVLPLPTVTIAGTTTVCENSSPAPTITLTNPMALPVTITYNINGVGTSTVNVAANSFTTISQPTTTEGDFVYNLVSVAYQTAPTCSNPISASATVTVNPTPTVNTIVDRILCNNTTAPGITLSGSVAGTTFTWTNSNPAIGLAASGSGNIPQFQAINGTNGTLEGIITVTPTANGCVGTPLTFTITVNPTLSASIAGSTTVCQNDDSPNITFTNPRSVPVTITYRRNSIAHTINVAANSTNTVAVPTITADTYTYELVTVAYQSNPTCPNAINGSAIVIVNPRANAVATPSTQAICSGQAINPIVLTSSTAGVTYNWTRNNTTTVTGIANSGSGNISGTLINTTSAPVIVTFTITANIGSCGGTPENATVTVYPTPVATVIPATQTRCSGEAISSIVPGSTTGGTTFTWTRDHVTEVTGLPASGTGPIPTVSLTNTTSSPITVTFTFYPSAHNCDGLPITATVLINSKASIRNLTASICNSGTFNVSPVNGVDGVVPPGTTYSWRIQSATVGITGAGSGSGSIISGTLGNSTNFTQSVTYAVTPTNNGCIGDLFLLTVTVTPEPAINTINRNVCSGNTFTVTPVNGTDGIVPTGTTYSWSAPTGGISGGEAGSGSSITGTLVNSTLTSQTATYTVTPVSGTCTGDPFTVNVTVNPVAAVTPMDASVCSGGNFTVTPVNGTNGVVPAGTTYSWTEPVVTGGVTGGGAGSGASGISGILTNPTSSVQTATYTVTPSSGGCAGVTFTVTVTVNPRPAVNPMHVTICSGGSFNLIPVDGTNGSVPTGTTYSWAAPNVTGITGTASGTDVSNISGQLYNTSGTARNVTYTVTPSAGACAGTSFSVIVTVNPAPSVNNMDATVCSSAGFSITPVNGTNGTIPPGTTYSWSAPTVPAGITGVTSGSSAANISGLLTNSTNTAQTITYVITPSSGSCAGSTFNLNITVNPVPSVTISGDAEVCYGGTAPSITFTNPVNLPVTATYTINGGANFTVSIAASGTTSIPATVNQEGTFVYNVVSVAYQTAPTCSTPVSGTATISVRPITTVVISRTPSGTICFGESVTFTSNVANAGTNPGYQWYVNGAAVSGATGISFTSTTLNNADKVQLVVTTADTPCPGAISSNEITMTVNPSVIPSVTIYESANPVCEGTSVTFTANPPVNGGATPVYQWQVNGSNVGGNSSTFTTNTLVSGDQVSVILISNANCAVNPVTSNTVTMTVNPNLPVSVSVAASANDVCAGTPVTFTATPTNGGTTPAYQWRVNGSNVGSNSSTYSYTPVHNDVVTVVLTSNAPCATGSPAASAPVTMTVNPNLPVSVSVAASANPVCAGTAVTFTATPTNGGTTPAYQWKVNDVNVGTNSNTYSYTPVHNDVVTVELTSNATCATGSPATSAPVTMTVSPNLPVSVSVAANTNTVCAGTPVTFTATPTNGGASPTYQWYNGATPIAGATGVTYTSATLTDGATITVQMTSNATCTTSSPAISNAISMTVNPSLPASVSIAAVPSGAICSGTSVTFTATPTNGGTSPTYQWYIGATPIAGATGGTYTSNTLTNGASITVQMTSNASCATGSPATSNAISVTVNPLLPASVSITAVPSGAICSGTNVTFTATPTNGGTTPTYQWYNGTAPIAGATGVTYSSTTLTDGASITVQMTSNATCATGSPATSNSITIQVDPGIPVAPALPTGDQSVCTIASLLNYSVAAVPNATSYVWTILTSTGNPAGWTISSGSGTNVISVNPGTPASGTYYISVRAINACGTSSASPTLTVSVGQFATANAGTDQTICAGQTATMNGLVGGAVNPNPPGNYNWSFSPAGSGSFSGNGRNPVFTPSAAGIAAGTITITLTTPNPAGDCEAVSDQMILTIRPLPTASITGSTTICSGSSTNITFTATPNTTVTYTVSGVVGQSTIAVGSGGTAMLTTPALTSTTTYTLVSVIYSTAPSCSQTATGSAIVTVNPTPTVNAGVDQTVCSSSPNVTLAGTRGGSASSATWSGGAGTFNPNNTTLNAVYTPSAAEMAAGTVTLTLTTNDPAGPCGQVSDQMVITINPAATVNANVDQTVCASSPNVTLAGSIGGAATSATWSGGAGTFNPTNTTLNAVYTPSAAEMAAGTVTLTLTTNDPAGPCGQVSDQMVITINPAATVNANVDQTVCASSPNVTLAGSIGGAATSATWSGGAGTFNPTNTTLNAVYTPSAAEIAAGTVTLTLTTNDPAGPCGQVSDQMVITINPAATVNANVDQTVCASSPNVTLAGSVGGAATSATWSGGAGTFNPTNTTLNVVYTPSAAEIAAGSVTLTLTTNDPAGPCGSATDQMIITINPAPTVNAGTYSPICSGSAVTLAGSISGGATTGTWTGGGGTFNPDRNTLNASYIPSGAEIAAGTVTLTLTTTDHPATCGPVSSTTTITINKAVVITTQPVNTGACVGESAVLSVAADGTNLSYQWYKGTAPGTPISGATSPTLALNSVSLTDDGSYYVVVTGESPCSEVTSTIVTLNVDAAIVITSQPANQTRCVGENVTFSVTADAGGAPLTYQWRKNGVELSGATLSTYSITGITSVADAGNYDVIVGSTAGFNCSSVTSAAASLSVNENGTILLTGDDDQTGCAGNSITAISYTIGGSSTGAVLTGFLPAGVTHSFSGGVFTISGTPTEQGTFNYTVTATGSPCENPSLSGAITVEGIGTISLGGGTATPTVCINNPISTITYSIGGNATGAVISAGSLPTGVTGVYANGQFTISGTPTSAGTYPFTVSTTGSSCGNPSLTGILVVNDDATIALTSANANQSLCLGSRISPISYASGGPATGMVLTGQLPAGVTGSIIGNVFTISGTPTATGTFNYTVATTGPCSNTSLSGVIQVDHLADVGYLSPAVSTVCTTTNSGTLTLESYSGNIIQWESSTDGGNTWTIHPVTNNTFTYTNLPNTTLFTALVGNGNCPALYSGIARVTVIPAFTPTITVTGGDVCSGEPVTLTGTAIILPVTTGVITGGDFNQSNPKGWRVTQNGVILSPFPASSNNQNQNPWALTNGPKEFCGTIYDSPDKKFSVVSGPFVSTMETPVFSLVAMSSAELSFTHAYNLSGGATAQVEISTDGGNTYSTVLAQYSGTLTGGNPNVVNPVDVDLSTYLGMDNLRIRFNYESTTCSSWAVDGITLPAPQPDADFAWGPTELIPGGSGSTIVVLPPTTTTYTLTVWIAGCPGVAEGVIVSVFNNPEVYTTDACVGGGDVTFTQSTVYGGTWSITGGGTITQDGVFTPTTPGCFEAIFTTSSGECSGTASFVVYPAAPAPTVNSGCGPIVVTPPPAIYGFDVEYSFDNGATWGANIPPTEESCSGYYIKTRYVTATVCDPTPVGEGSLNTVCSESPATIRRIDYSDPTFTAPADITIYKDAACNYNALPSVTGDVTDEYDNCIDDLEATFTDVIVPGQCEDELIIERTWLLEDGCGQPNVQIQRITVSDNTPPVISPLAADVQSACSTADPNVDPGYQAWLASRGGAAATDNCDQIVTWSDNSATQTWSGVVGNNQITITWVATDNCGNTAETTATYSITDTEAPILVCPASISETALLNNCGKILVTPSDPIVNDNCSTPVLSYTLSGATTVTTPVVGTVAGVTFNVGVTTVTYTATDAAGNASEPCSFTVTILDVTPPNLTITGCVNVSESAAANNCSKIPVTIIDPTYTDDCWPLDQLTLSWTMSGATTGSGTGSVVGQSFNVGVTTVTYLVEDPDGNQATCSFTVTILDVTAPNLTISGCEDVSESAAANNCSKIPVTIIDPTYSDDCWPLDQLTLSWTMSGATTGSGTGSVAGQTFNVGETMVTYQVEDPDGNTATCSFNVTILDVTAPNLTISGCEDVSESAAADNCSKIPVTIIDPTYSDNCWPLDQLTLSWTMSGATTGSGTGSVVGQSFNVGVTTVTYLVEDPDGNQATCSFTVTILDITSPNLTISGCEDVSESATANNCSTIPVTIIDPTYSDDCWPVDSLMLTWTMSGATTGSGIGSVAHETFNVGETTVTYVVEDPDGNTATCSFTVTILRLSIPQAAITCPDSPAPVTAVAGTCYGDVIVDPPIEVDPCETVTYTFENDFNHTANASGSYPVGTTTVVWTITDNSGRTTTCEQTVVVNDLHPTITCPQPITVQADFEVTYQDEVTVPEPAFSDNCPNPTIAWTLVPPVAYASEYEPAELSGNGSYPSPSTFYLGITTITYVVTDANNHTATCSFTVTVLAEPEITCLPAVSYDTDAGQCTATRNSSAYGLPTLERGLQPITWTWIITNPDGTTHSSTEPFIGSSATPGPPTIPDYAFRQGTSTITWRAENSSGFDECTQTVMVNDNEVPTILPPQPFIGCVENIKQAIYNDVPEGNPFDLTYLRPDYYTFVSGDNKLDLDPLTFFDNCSLLNCAVEIRWKVTMADGTIIPDLPALYEIGQPSTFGSDIIFLGDGLNFLNTNHTITYWIVDCNGNVSDPVDQIITIVPRPNITRPK